jgi:predicted nucleotidyltransferase
MLPTIPPLVQRTVRRLVRAFAPEKIILFGSFAKGTTHDFSDIDLLLVTNQLEFTNENRKRAKQLSADCFPSVDVVFATKEEYDNPGLLKSTFLSTILATGIIIYERN